MFWYTLYVMVVLDMRTSMSVDWMWCVRIFCVVHWKIQHWRWLMKHNRRLTIDDRWSMKYH